MPIWLAKLIIYLLSFIVGVYIIELIRFIFNKKKAYGTLFIFITPKGRKVYRYEFDGELDELDNRTVAIMRIVKKKGSSAMDVPFDETDKMDEFEDYD